MVFVTHDFFLNEGLLEPGHSVVGIICTEDGLYLAQLRSQKKGIYYPGYWGFFGGGVESGESPEDALQREIMEELNLEIWGFSYFTEFHFDFKFQGSEKLYRKYYSITIQKKQLLQIKLGEGDAIETYRGDRFLKMPNIVPYDAFALWLHYTQQRIKNDFEYRKTGH